MFSTCRIILTDLLLEESQNRDSNFLGSIVQVFACGLAEHNCSHAKECRQFIEQNMRTPEPLIEERLAS